MKVEQLDQDLFWFEENKSLIIRDISFDPISASEGWKSYLSLFPQLSDEVSFLNADVG